MNLNKLIVTCVIGFGVFAFIPKVKDQTLWVVLCVVEFYKTNENAKKGPLFLMFNIIYLCVGLKMFFSSQ